MWLSLCVILRVELVFICSDNLLELQNAHSKEAGKKSDMEVELLNGKCFTLAHPFTPLSLVFWTIVVIMHVMVDRRLLPNEFKVAFVFPSQTVIVNSCSESCGQC